MSGAKNLIKKLLDKVGYRVTSTRYRLKQLDQPDNLLNLEFDHVISDYLIHKKNGPGDFTFMQIGAFDGVECDPLLKYLNKYDWKGVMLEPQPAPFSKLNERYANRDNISVRNAAISSENGTTTLYVLEGDNLPEWAKGMASFSKQNILKHNYLFPDIDKHVKEAVVNTITFQKLLEEETIKILDLLQVDTEGFDAEVLRIFPFDRIKPKLIHFESKHIKKNDLELLLDKLIGLGYKVARDREEDMLAVLQEKVAD